MDERRHQRSESTLPALGFQLQACLEAGALEAVVLADEDGLVIASAGDTEKGSEVATRLPQIGRRVPEFSGVLYSSNQGFAVQMQRVALPDSEVYLCAIGDAAKRDSVLKKGASGVMRILGA